MRNSRGQNKFLRYLANNAVLCAAIALTAGTICRPVAASPRSDLARQIEAYLRAHIIPPAQTDMEFGLDALAALPEQRCSQPVDIQTIGAVAALGNTHVIVACRAPMPWRATVPVTVRGIAAVVVAAHSLKPGQIVAPQDIRQIKMDISNLHQGYYTQPQAVAGTLVKRAVTAGMPVYAHQLRPAFLVKRGEKVYLTTENAHISIRMMGVALKDGALGDIVPVRNLSSRRVVEGIVTERQEVTVRL